MQKKTIPLRTFIITILCLSIISSSCFLIIYASNSNTFTISEGIYPSAVSYTIWRSGNNYYAKDEYGLIPTWGSGTNASQIIGDALTEIATGGKLYLKAGKYDLQTSPIKLNITNNGYGVEIVGESSASTYLYYTGTGSALTIESGLDHYYFRLSSLRIDGASITAGRYGLLIKQIGRNVYLENLEIVNCEYGLLIEDTNTVFVNGIKITSCTYGIRLKSGVHSFPNVVKIENFKISSITQKGIYLWDGNKIMIKDGTIENAETGIFLNVCQSVHIEDIFFESNTGWEIDALGYNSASPTKNIHIQDCYLASSTDYAIRLKYVDGCKITNLWSWTHNIAFIWCDSNTKNVTIDNPINVYDPLLLGGSPPTDQIRVIGQGYQDSGTSEASDQDWIAHGLLLTPTMVQLTIEETDSNYALQLRDKNSTHFQIYLYDLTADILETVDKTINWYCEYQP